MNTGSRPRPSVRLKCLVLGAAGAGKTSLLRRYFHKRFDSQRTPTLGCDFYTARVADPTSLFSQQQQQQETPTTTPTTTTNPTVWVSLQMWDTPGRERINFKRRRPSENTYASSFGSRDFFRQADAVMLVYDMTSSTSFTQLMKWYADLIELQQQNKPLPILIVANKLDLLQNHLTPPHHPRRRTVPQRDVMGLRGSFRGNDFQYEYQVSSSSNKSDVVSSPTSNLRRKKKPHKGRMEISSFLVNRENWTSDWSYLASLLNSEDQSHPDRDMVLLWCMRNGLPHCEASAATGEGVTEAVESMLKLALESKKPQPTEEPSMPMTRGRLDRLDLHQRYAVKEENVCSTFILRPLLHLFHHKNDTR